MAIAFVAVGGAWLNAKFRADTVDVAPPPELVFIDNPPETSPPEVIVPEDTDVAADLPTAIDFVLPEFVYTETAPTTVSVPDTAPTAATPTPSAAPGVTKAAKLIRRAPPQYPPASIRAQEAGEMSLEVCVTEKGTVASAEVTRSTGFPRLDEAALKWIRAQRFSPALVSGRPQATCGIPVDYVWDLRNAG